MMTMQSVEPPSRTRQADRRSAVLAVLRAADTPVSVEEVAAATGIAESTAQFHLSMLVGAGTAVRTPQRTGSAGRPSWRYAPAARTPAADPSAGRATPAAYEELARVLAAQLDGSTGGAAAARDAGHRWAETIPSTAERPASSPEVAVASLTAALDRLGFAPESRLPAREIVLRACPFEAVAREHRAVVCSVHLGLVERAAAALGGGIAVDGLEPFRSEQPLACVVRLRVRALPVPAPEGGP